MGVGTANNTFIVFNTGRLLFQVAKTHNQLHCKCQLCWPARLYFLKALRTIQPQLSWTKNRQKPQVHSVLEAEMQQTGLLSSVRVNRIARTAATALSARDNSSMTFCTQSGIFCSIIHYFFMWDESMNN